MNLEELKNRIFPNVEPWHHPARLTMLPLTTINNIEYCIKECVKNGIEGDYIECGVWRGGAVIFANEVFKSLGEKRKIYVADSFEGLPIPDPQTYPADAGDSHYLMEDLKVSLEDVKNNFLLFGELEENIVFLKGWFKDTLPVCDVEKLCVLRADGDMYESTMDILTNLYPKLSVGGFCIIDDFGHGGCVKAVHDYRLQNGITDTIIRITPPPAYPSSYWIKS
jgi:hypothetical protein